FFPPRCPNPGGLPVGGCALAWPMRMKIIELRLGVVALLFAACVSCKDDPLSGDHADGPLRDGGGLAEAAVHVQPDSVDGGGPAGRDGATSMEAGQNMTTPNDGGVQARADAGGASTGHGQRNDGCASHADCSPGYVCYLGVQLGQTCVGGPSGSCATCQGGSCVDGFVCSCLSTTMCDPTAAAPCTDNGKLIVCPPAPAN
ncbi:MAG: hypothetical protein JWN04_650, partial [Myxococcaceae bacterium]|nr:hypothetical protein [Myxococcaceae bacterium]